MADPQGPSVQDIIAALGAEKGNATQHQKASDLLDIVKLMRDERKDAAQGAVPESLLKYIVPKSQQFHAGWEPGGIIDQMARLAGVNLGGLNGFRSSSPIPLSLLLKQTVKQPNMLEDIDSASSVWDKLFGSPPASTQDSPAAPPPPAAPVPVTAQNFSPIKGNTPYTPPMEGGPPSVEKGNSAGNFNNMASPKKSPTGSSIGPATTPTMPSFKSRGLLDILGLR